MDCVQLAIGGESWTGWTFGRYGRAKDWRIMSPTGEYFVAGELLSMRAVALDLDYLQLRVRELEDEADKEAIYLSDAEVAALRNAADILARAMPKPKRLARAV